MVGMVDRVEWGIDGSKGLREVRNMGVRKSEGEKDGWGMRVMREDFGERVIKRGLGDEGGGGVGERGVRKGGKMGVREG